MEAKGLIFYYREDVVPHLDRLCITYENDRFGLKDKA